MKACLCLQERRGLQVHNNTPLAGKRRAGSQRRPRARRRPRRARALFDHMKRKQEEEAAEQSTPQLFATNFPSVRYLHASTARRPGAADSHCLCVEGRRDRLPVSQFLAHLQERGRAPPSGATVTEPSPPIFECSCSLAGCPDRLAMQGPSPPPRMVLLDAKGWGLCASGDLPAGAFVCDYRGEVLSASEAVARLASYELAGLQHTFLLCVRESFGARVNVTAIDATHAGNEGRCINHSCRPNLVLELVRTAQPLADGAGRPSAAPVIRACFFTQRPVAAGEELTIDYAEGSSTVGAGDMRGVNESETAAKSGQERSHTRCLCGEDNCRRWLPRHTAPLGERRAEGSAAPPSPPPRSAADSAAAARTAEAATATADATGDTTAAAATVELDPGLGALLDSRAFGARVAAAITAGLGGATGATHQVMVLPDILDASTCARLRARLEAAHRPQRLVHGRVSESSCVACDRPLQPPRGAGARSGPLRRTPTSPGRPGVAALAVGSNQAPPTALASLPSTAQVRRRAANDQGELRRQRELRARVAHLDVGVQPAGHFPPQRLPPALRHALRRGAARTRARRRPAAAARAGQAAVRAGAPCARGRRRRRHRRRDALTTLPHRPAAQAAHERRARLIHAVALRPRRSSARPHAVGQGSTEAEAEAGQQP